MRFEPFRDFHDIVEEREAHRGLASRDLPRSAPPWDFIAGDFGLTVHDETGKGPSRAQAEAFAAFMADARRTATRVLDAVVNYYRRSFADYRRDLDEEDADRVMPPVKTPAGLRELMTFQGLSVYPATKGKPPSIGLSFHCSWDEEHGLGVRWREGKVEEVGQADVAIGG